ncbi:MAG: hypothetical protein KBD28_04340 [Chitinophagaceae bacterium]|nr:hypothetical protein [Chitinophagaceae bacterium]
MKLFTFLIIVATFLSYNKKDDFTNLFQLTGSWQMKTPRVTIGEIWTKNNEHQLSSKAYYLKNTDTIFTESVLLHSNKAGIFYTATAANQNNEQPIDFKLTSSLNNKFVFENKKHDFPKRILYEFVNPDSIHAFIDDGKEPTTKRKNFYFSRIK